MRRLDTLTLFRPPNWRGGLPHCPCIGRRFDDRSIHTLHSHSLVALRVLPSYTLVAVALDSDTITFWWICTLYRPPPLLWVSHYNDDASFSVCVVHTQHSHFPLTHCLFSTFARRFWSSHHLPSLQWVSHYNIDASFSVCVVHTQHSLFHSHIVYFRPTLVDLVVTPSTVSAVGKPLQH